MMDVYYRNHTGETVNLKSGAYHLLEGDLLDYKWSVVSMANQITGFAKGIHEKSITFEIFAKKAEYHQALDKVTEVFEKDILAGVPGRLYLNGQYLKCFMTESTKAQWESDVLAVTELTVTTDYPYWIEEKETHFMPMQAASEGDKIYPFCYPYRYASGLSDKSIMNEHYADTDFRLIVFGPAANPAIFIGNHLYQMNIQLEKGEYVCADSAQRTIILTKNDGSQVNVFNDREKEQDIFAKIPQGMSHVKWSGDFGFDIVLFQERSQPKCA